MWEEANEAAGTFQLGVELANTTGAMGAAWREAIRLRLSKQASHPQTGNINWLPDR